MIFAPPHPSSLAILIPAITTRDKMSTSTWVCFPCRKHRSIPRTFYRADENQPAPSHPCAECHQPLVHIGHKLEVPKQADVHAWHRFYDQFTAPGYGDVGIFDPPRGQENEHWMKCAVKPFERCQQCRDIGQRMPEQELESWRRGRWVNALQMRKYR